MCISAGSLMTFSGDFQEFLYGIVKGDETKRTHITGSPHIYVHSSIVVVKSFVNVVKVPASRDRARG